MLANFSDSAKMIFHLALEEANITETYVFPGHFMIALIREDSDFRSIVGVQVEALPQMRVELRDYLSTTTSQGSPRNLLTREAELTLLRAGELASNSGLKIVGTDHISQALFELRDVSVIKILGLPD